MTVRERTTFLKRVPLGAGEGSRRRDLLMPSLGACAALFRRKEKFFEMFRGVDLISRTTVWIVVLVPILSILAPRRIVAQSSTQVIRVDRSPVSSTFGHYVGGQKGTTVSVALSIFF